MALMLKGTALRLAKRTISAPTRFMGSSGGGGIPRPFARTLQPSEPLHEEHELIWDDGVAAEATIDFDAPFIGSSEGLKMWLGGLAFFASFLGLITLSGPENRRQAVKRGTEGVELPFDNAKAAFGLE
eukprot:CAMPEP_0114349590 /NCGR_PEP_ID=MMETSP0101-20121206/15652_1 /TAXON_ID=38822 ORGANISM="Pteridomonas danica, Strain PT" /NCGR_SAMPLE_ID=MMETSP0101 /ASSEMBLY_ACC=CAM_ASM_000211 /LENGTH=127 /DNA_ID=CAMNT_0001488251 /DNA_START=18 /DNA_END=401 /DNA_ORIENTATION=-